MEFTEVLELARLIEAEDRAKLIAIGRFIPAAEIGPADPWGCSILPRGKEKTVIVWNLSDYRLECPTMAPVATPAAAAAPRPDDGLRRQPTLF